MSWLFSLKSKLIGVCFFFSLSFFVDRILHSVASMFNVRESDLRGTVPTGLSRVPPEGPAMPVLTVILGLSLAVD